MHSFIQRVQKNATRLKHHVCLGLDPDPALMPHHYPKSIEGIRSFLWDVIDATKNNVVAYKPNMAFFEVWGIEGIALLQDLRKAIPAQVPIILDAKRGDIGNTSAKIASYLIDYLKADAITLHPYMGLDSLLPFFNYKDCFHFVLGLTSNPGAKEFECLRLSNQDYVYDAVLNACRNWHHTYGNVGAVVGATHDFMSLRLKYPELFFLVPGVGFQGARYEDVIHQTDNKMTLVNITRELLFFSKEKDYLDLLIQKLLSYST